MNTQQQNAFTAHYQQHDVYKGLAQALSNGFDLSNINAFVTTLWENGLSVVPAQVPPPASFSLEKTKALPGTETLQPFALIALCGCINAWQQAVDYGDDSFHLELAVAGQDRRHHLLSRDELYILMGTLIRAGVVVEKRSNYALSDMLAAAVATQPAAETATIEPIA